MRTTNKVRKRIEGLRVVAEDVEDYRYNIIKNYWYR